MSLSFAAAIDYGSVPNWFSALGSIGALTVAIFALHYARKSFNAQQVQLGNLLEDRKREQASKVAVWTFTENGDLQYRIKNTSGLPIYLTELWIMGAGVIGPICTQHLPFVPPGESTVSVPKAGKVPAGHNDQTYAGIAFQDAAGRQWKRDAWGTLTELSLSELNDLAKSLNGK